MQGSRELLPAWMLERYWVDRHAGWPRVPPVRRRPVSEGPPARIEALAKLNALFEAGVLTAQQFADERSRLLADDP